MFVVDQNPQMALQLDAVWYRDTFAGLALSKSEPVFVQVHSCKRRLKAEQGELALA